MILNPTTKWKWCKTNWKDKEGWIEQAQKNMRRLWESYKPTQSTEKKTKRAYPDRGEKSSKSVRREGNYRD